MYTLIEKKQEFSERCFQLTTDVIPHNPANYTAWWFRRRCLPCTWEGPNEQESDLKHDSLIQELAYVRRWCKDTPKNYQAWFHRRWVIDQLDQPLDELDCLREELDEDPKNMNVWAQQHHVVKRFLPLLLKMYVPKCCELDHSAHRLWSVLPRDVGVTVWRGDAKEDCEGCWIVKELRFSDQLIRRDCRNHTAMSFRRSLIEDLVNSAGQWSYEGHLLLKEFLEDEIKYFLTWCETCSHNESAWILLQSFFLTEEMILQNVYLESKNEVMQDDSFIRNSRNRSRHVRVPWTHRIVTDEVIPVVDKALGLDAFNRHALYVTYLISLSRHDLDEAKKWLLNLVTADPIRRRYWSQRLSVIDSILLGNATRSADQ